MKWISVTRRLPPHRQVVIVWETSNGGGCALGCYVYEPSGDSWYLDCEAASPVVSHWAEITAPKPARPAKPKRPEGTRHRPNIELPSAPPTWTLESRLALQTSLSGPDVRPPITNEQLDQLLFRLFSKDPRRAYLIHQRLDQGRSRKELSADLNVTPSRILEIEYNVYRLLRDWARSLLRVKQVSVSAVN